MNISQIDFIVFIAEILLRLIHLKITALKRKIYCVFMKGVISLLIYKDFCIRLIRAYGIIFFVRRAIVHRLECVLSEYKQKIKMSSFCLNFIICERMLHTVQKVL